MDLSKVGAPTDREIELINPVDGELTGLFLTIAVSHDARVQKNVRALRDKYIVEAAKASKGKAAKADTESQEDRIFAAAHIVGCRWTGDATWNGETPDYSIELAYGLANQPFWRTQIVTEAYDVKAFYSA